MHISTNYIPFFFFFCETILANNNLLNILEKESRLTVRTVSTTSRSDLLLKSNAASYKAKRQSEFHFKEKKQITLSKLHRSSISILLIIFCSSVLLIRLLNIIHSIQAEKSLSKFHYSFPKYIPGLAF